jgi:uncharacterized protein DUF1360
MRGKLALGGLMSTAHTGTNARGLGLVVDALACYRFVKLIRDDRVFEPVRDSVAERHGPPERSKLSYFLACPWCLSFYAGAALTLCRARWPRATEGVARTLALSALVGVTSRYVDQR